MECAKVGPSIQNVPARDWKWIFIEVNLLRFYFFAWPCFQKNGFYRIFRSLLPFGINLFQYGLNAKGQTVKFTFAEEAKKLSQIIKGHLGLTFRHGYLPPEFS